MAKKITKQTWKRKKNDDNKYYLTNTQTQTKQVTKHIKKKKKKKKTRERKKAGTVLLNTRFLSKGSNQDKGWNSNRY